MALLVRGGEVLRGDPPALARADVLVEGDRIADVGPAVTAPPGAEVVDATGCLVVPGLVNAHTHGHNILLRGLADRWTLEDLLNHGPALNANRTPEDHYVGAALNAVEMLRTGCTGAYELFMTAPAPTLDDLDAVARAYADVGMRAVIAPAVADIVFWDAVPGLVESLPKELRRRVEEVRATPTETLLKLGDEAIRRLHGGAGGRIRVSLAPTIPTQCTDAFLEGCARQVREHGVGLHTHLSESKVQAIAAQRRWGKTAVERLAELGLLGPGFVGAHGVWLTDDDIRRLGDAGAAIAHNPASNLRLGNGIAAVREMLDRGVTVGLGSDGSMSSDNQNLFEAMRLAGLIGNIRFPHLTDRWVSAGEVWRMATLGSARAVGQGDELGAIERGRFADLVLLRGDGAFLRPRSDVAGSLVYVETGSDVDAVIASGRVVVRGGKVLTVDEARLRERAQEAADRLRRQNTAGWAMAAELAPFLSTACRAAAVAPYPVNRYAAPVP
ncbi:MAG: amidohydrolase [Candidatus Rokubacteria bacterium]|nr:amidohydrolase [Candidatus Rokubacteria bacterium]